MITLKRKIDGRITTIDDNSFSRWSDKMKARYDVVSASKVALNKAEIKPVVFAKKKEDVPVERTKVVPQKTENKKRIYRKRK